MERTIRRLENFTQLKIPSLEQRIRAESSNGNVNRKGRDGTGPFVCGKSTWCRKDFKI